MLLHTASRYRHQAAPTVVIRAALLSVATLVSTACVAEQSVESTATLFEVAPRLEEARRFEEAPRYTLREERRIGSSTDPNLSFTLITGVALDSQGFVYAFDARESELRVFDHGGQLIRKIGRRGQGPGEFRSTPLFGVTGDTIWTLEPGGLFRPQQIALFTLRGDLISIAEVNALRVTLHGERRAGIVSPDRLQDGLLHGRMNIFTTSRPDDPPAPTPTDTLRVPRVRWNLAGEIVDTVGWDDHPPPLASDDVSLVNAGVRRLIVPNARAAENIFITLADGVVVVDNRAPTDAMSATSRIIRLDDKGDTLFSRSYGYEPYPYDDASLDALAWRTAKSSGWAPVISGVPTPGPAPADSMVAYTTVRAAMQFPPYQRPFTQHSVGEDGSFWLARYHAAGSDEWILFDHEGALMGQLTLPPKTRIMLINGTIVWASVTDDLDVQWLVKYALQQPETPR